MTPSLAAPLLTWLTPTFAVTSALNGDDFAALAGQGIRGVISNRPDGEEAGQMTAPQEATTARQHRLDFRHVPAAKTDLFTDGVVEGMARALQEMPGPVVAHCKSGLRSAIVWAAASSRMLPVAEVIDALEHAGFDLADVIRDDLDAQADRTRWSGAEGPVARDAA